MFTICISKEETIICFVENNDSFNLQYQKKKNEKNFET